MTPGTGTPDYVASTTRLRFGRRPTTRARALLPIVFLSFCVVVAGCVSQPPVTDGGAIPVPEETVSATAWNDPGPPPTSEMARSERDPLPTIENRSPVPTDPAAFVMPGGDLAKISPGLQQPVEDVVRNRDTWARIRDGLSLPHPLHPRVVREIGWYRKNQEYLHRTAQRGRPYLAYIVHQVEQRGMPIEFALLPIVESAFMPFAYSPAGASGLWQFMPSTGRRYGLKQNWWYDGRRDVVASTRAALDYLSKLLQDFDGDRLLAVAAYNWGEGNVRRVVSRNRARGKPVDVWSLKLPRETRSHVSRLLAIAAIVEDPSRYGVVLEAIPDHIHFQQVALDDQIDLSVAADLAGITLDEIRRLNPGFNHWATDPSGPHRLQLPSYAVERFRSRIGGFPVENRVRWARHEIVRGDTLGAIANRYRTSVAVLKEHNRLASDRIRAGHHLMVPVSIRTIDTPRLSKAMRARLDSVATESSVKSVHRVRSGDNLSQIARKHGVGMKQLAAWNGLSMKTVLQPGQRLTVYRRNAGPARTAPPKPAAEPFKASQPAIIHVVEHGDTLSGIAKRHGTTVFKLTEFNRINKDAILRLGQKLHLIPAAYSKTRGSRESIRYQVKRGDSLWEISRQFGVSVASLRQWNQLPTGEPLMPGRELDVHLTGAPAI